MNFDWHNSYPSVRTPVFARNLVATSQPLAAQAGLRMLQAGGNAADAAVAAAAVITMTEPCSNGLGADNFAIVWDPSSKSLLGMNSSGISPAAWTHDYFRRKYGDDLARTRPMRGWDTVTVPGAAAGWALLHRRLGRLAFSDVMAPAIEYAERGFAVSPIVHDKWQRAVPLLHEGPGWADHFMPRGRAPEIGEHFVLAGAARTLTLIAREGGAAFYHGEIAAAIERHAKATGGALTARDLAAYWDWVQQAGWVDTISTSFMGHELHEIPPNGQGIAALSCLGILRHTALADYAVDSADWQHVAIEAMKLAFADTYAYVADPRAMAFTPAALLDDGYLAQRARLIDMRQARAPAAGAPPRGGTIYLSAADADGMMVSLIQSNYMGFGSGVVVPGYGISLQNRGQGFSMNPASPNVVAPAKRPFHTIIPGFLMKDGAPQMSFGVMGGNMQPQGHVQTLVRMLLARQQPQAACDAPRWKVMSGLDLEVEASLPLPVVEELAQRGHRITRANDSYMDFGSGQFIWRLGDPAIDGYVAASDSRRDGLVAGC
ncbi:MAG TPA: gamma-glutamyltransferase family protein [Burkholderiaceae bacterium]|nr:gamma-glutamyltransferase family protein [Burkholderiaceae bacterium]